MINWPSLSKSQLRNFLSNVNELIGSLSLCMPLLSPLGAGSATEFHYEVYIFFTSSGGVVKADIFFKQAVNWSYITTCLSRHLPWFLSQVGFLQFFNFLFKLSTEMWHVNIDLKGNKNSEFYNNISI